LQHNAIHEPYAYAAMKCLSVCHICVLYQN